MPYPFDEIILQQVQSISNPLLDSVMLAVTFLGNPAFWIIVAAIIYWRGKENESFYLMNLIVFTSAFVALTKYLFKIPRPSAEVFRIVNQQLGPLYQQTGILNYSFPSGHSAIVASVLGHFYYKIKGNWKIVVLLLVSLVALSRIYLGQHFLSDVIAGLAIGFLIGKGNKWLIRNLKEHHFKPTKIQEEIGVVIAVIAAIVLAVFFEPSVLVVTVLGFYGGFFLLKELELKSEYVEGRNFYQKTILGFIGLGLILSPIVIFQNITSPLLLLLFFISGAWISAVYPFLYNKVFKVKTT